MNLFFRYPRTHIRLVAILILSLLFCIANVQATYVRLKNKTRLINNSQNQQIELGIIEDKRDLLSPVLNYGKISWAPIIFLYLEGDELRECNMVCKTFYNIIHSKTFLESRAEMEFEKTLENYFQKFNPQIEKIGPYEIKMTIQNIHKNFVLDKFESKKFYLPFSLIFYKSNEEKHFQAIFLPNKNIQENYLPPFEMPERHIPFNSNLLVSAIPKRFRMGRTPDDQKLVQVIYKINFQNMNQIFETYSKNKYPVKCRKIKLKRKFALYWTIWGGLLALDYLFWYIVATYVNVIAVFCFMFAYLLSACLIVYTILLLIFTFVKLPNNGSDDL